jgi:death-on-curing family protein
LDGGYEKLEAAVARPEQYLHYERPDRALLASVLAHGIANAHAFEDGNKRTAFLSMTVFLELSGGYSTYAPKRISQRWMIDLTTGVAVEAVAAEIRPYLDKIR